MGSTRFTSPLNSIDPHLFDDERLLMMRADWEEAILGLPQFDREVFDCRRTWERTFSLDRDAQRQGTPRDPLCCIGGPGGVGKSTIIESLLVQHRSLVRVLLHTTRPARRGEEEGRQYFFVTCSRFESMRRQGDFAVEVEVRGRGSYGLSWTNLRSIAREGGSGILDTNVELYMLLTEVSGRDHHRAPSYLYILPPFPPFDHLLARVFTRTVQDIGRSNANHIWDEVRKTVNGSQVRQIGKALDVKRKGFPVSFLINDQLDDASDVIRALI